MKVININKIEELNSVKNEIYSLLNIKNDDETPKQLRDFLMNYVNFEYVYIINSKYIPFKFANIKDNQYLFVSDTTNEEIQIILNKLKYLKYDLNNLIKLQYSDIMNIEEFNNVIIYNNNFYN